MKRELKEGLTDNVRELAVDSDHIPMKRELKDTLSRHRNDAVALRFRPHPDEEGTERDGDREIR